MHERIPLDNYNRLEGGLSGVTAEGKEGCQCLHAYAIDVDNSKRGRRQHSGSRHRTSRTSADTGKQVEKDDARMRREHTSGFS